MCKKIETMNDHLIGIIGDDLNVAIPLQGRISKAEALRTAAWLIVLAGDDEYEDVLNAVRNT